MVLKKLIKFLKSSQSGAGMGDQAIGVIMSVGFIGIFGWIILYSMDIIQEATPIGVSNTTGGVYTYSPFYNASVSLTSAVEIGFNLQTIIVVIMVFGIVIGGLYYMWGRNQP